jgi:S1-C subfamily serine protease
VKKLAVYVVGILVLISAWALYPTSHSKLTNKDKAEATVKIVNLAENSGGTGVILESGTISHVLTNNHICEIAKKGAFVVLDNGTKYQVMSFRQSNLHDVCLIAVAADLKVNTSISSVLPPLYSEAVVSGHPSLLPTIITTGHFSGKMLGTVMIGRKKCATITDRNVITCLLLGGTPIIKNYEMQVISATIKPGSSGSAVYDASGNIAGLVFAGSGEIGYGMIVPLEYIINFLVNELPRIPDAFPSSVEGDDTVSSDVGAREYCKMNIIPELKPLCDLIEQSTLFVK